MHHGICYLHENWAGVLNKCLTFLKDHPTEFIIVKLQMEYKPEGNTNTTWGGLVLQVWTCGIHFECKKALEDIPEEKLWKKENIPTVGEARGKIVLTCWSPKVRPKYPSLGFIPWGGETKEDESKYIQVRILHCALVLRRQDLYDGPTISSKWKEFLALWARSYVEKQPKTFFVNHATASGLRPGTTPKDYAKVLHLYHNLLPF